MGADYDKIGIRYREKDSTPEWEKRRDEIADFIFAYAEKSSITGEVFMDHTPVYSEIQFEEVYGHIGEFCGLPDEMIKQYPDVQFEFHFIEWDGGVSEDVDIYDGVHHFHHEFTAGELMEAEMDESPEEDPYLTEESVFSAYEDFTDGPNYYYILGS